MFRPVKIAATIIAATIAKRSRSRCEKVTEIQLLRVVDFFSMSIPFRINAFIRICGY
jgi:hypothetical protein